MGPIRRFLLTKLGARTSTAITVGLHTSPDGERTVAIYLSEGWRRIPFRLSPDGARRIAAHMTEWADAADKHNAERPAESLKMIWKYVVNAAGEGAAETKPGDPPPVAQAT